MRRMPRSRDGRFSSSFTCDHLIMSVSKDDKTIPNEVGWETVPYLDLAGQDGGLDQKAIPAAFGPLTSFVRATWTASSRSTP